ncbi:MAG: hypothetical protein ACRC2R_00405 [Xenococcaceae cyanobacterium]
MASQSENVAENLECEQPLEFIEEVVCVMQQLSKAIECMKTAFATFETDAVEDESDAQRLFPVMSDR